MHIEYEATFYPVEKDDVRERLKQAGAELVRPEFLQKRVTFNLPAGHEIDGGWLRVRDEGDKITMSLKIIDGGKISDQKEICLIIDDFAAGVNFLNKIGCREKSYQETRREIWKLDGVEITIDQWPYLEPLVEIEGGSEEAVKAVSEKLGFGWEKALFCSITTLYSMKYGLEERVINNQVPIITFEEANPFEK